MTPERTLPEGWRWVRLGDVVRNVRETVSDPIEAGIERYIGLADLDPESLHIRRWGLVEEGTTFTQVFRPGQVLFAKRRAYQRKVAVAEFEGICSGDLLVFEPEDEAVLLPDLLPFIMMTDSFFDHALATSAGSLSPRTKPKDLARYEFALPPLDEQRRIAEILWAADEAKQGYSIVLRQSGAVRQATINRLCPDTSQGDAQYRVVQLQEVAEMQEGRVFPSSDYTDAGIKLLRPGNLGPDGYLAWSTDITRWLPGEYIETASDLIIESGDVVINLTAQSLEDGFMGRVCLAQSGDQSLLNQRLGRFICQEQLLPEYLYRYLQTTQFRRLVEARCEGSKIKHLYWRHLADFKLLLPSTDIQQTVIDTIAQIDDQIVGTQQHVDSLLTLDIALRRSMVDAKETVERIAANV